MPPHGFQYGVIEGFFGKPWSWQDRRRCAAFLKDHGYGFYIYAPKADDHLRRQWQRPWPEHVAREVGALAQACRRAGLLFGIGLSPYEIFLDYGARSKAQLRAKVAELNAVDPDILCVQFDDMRGDTPDLAQIQAEVVHEVAASSSARAFVMCPTYYSHDPILEKVFGAMPRGHLEELGRRVDTAIDVFWTGPRVCSTHYPEAHLRQVAEALGRKPFLWDNYPVNDGARMCNHLHLRAFENRPATLRESTAGHAVNPMNQAWLSRIPLRTLADSYRSGEDYRPQAALLEACRALCGRALGDCLAGDVPLLQDRGLRELDAAQRQGLAEKYRAFAGEPYATEILAWLAGEYAVEAGQAAEFDPGCLTQ